MKIRRTMRVATLAVPTSAAIIAVPASTTAALPASACGMVSGGSSTSFGHITAVRVGHHVGFDRFVVQFSGVRVPRYTAIPKSSAVFTLDPSGRPVRLRGTAGIKIVMHPAGGQGTYTGPSHLRTTFPQLLEARRIGDFEGFTTWGLGLRHQSCKRGFTLSVPTRLVVDVPK